MGRAERRVAERQYRSLLPQVCFRCVRSTEPPDHVEVLWRVITHDLPEVAYVGEEALDRLRRFVLGYLGGAAGTHRSTAEKLIESAAWNKEAVTDGAYFETAQVTADIGRYRGRFRAFGDEACGEWHGRAALDRLVQFIEPWLLRFHGPDWTADEGVAPVVYPDAASVADALKANATPGNPAPVFEQAGRWSFGYSKGPPISMFSAKLQTRSSETSDWEFLGAMCAQIGVPTPPDRYQIGDTVRTDPNAVHKWAWPDGVAGVEVPSAESGPMA